jgi:hypothetical protein
MAGCEFRDMFGKPGEGVHSFRVFDIAVVDVILTFLLAWGVSELLHVNYWVVLLALFLTAIILHRLFCVNTTVNVALFGTV